jgi:hypothetical protein
MLRNLKCLYCGRKLNWRKWLRRDDFCSDEHDTAYRSESDLRLIDRLNKSASPDYGMSWKYADNSGYSTPDMSLQLPNRRVDSGSPLPVPNLAAVATAISPDPARIQPRLMLTAPESNS